MKMYAGMDRYSVQKADHVIAISEVVKEETMRYDIPEEKITVIHNGIDVEKFRVSTGKREAVRKRLELDGTVIGYIGRLEPHKNVGELIESVADLGREDVNLLIVGDGEDAGHLKAKASPLGSKAVFTGYVDYGEVPDYYAASDIVVYPSLYEPLGNVILETMAAGKPIIAMETGGISEIFVKGTGYLVSPGSGELMECLDELVADENKRRRMGLAGLRAVGRNSWKNVAEKTVEVCERVLDSRSGK
jgi:glycosyltransferase involved in cell wall biosynthesis